MGTPLRRTPATVAVLRVLLAESDPVWGLRVSKLAERPTGSVYPILERLEAAGHLTSTWELDGNRTGPRRRLYALTPAGREWATEQVREPAPRRAPRPSLGTARVSYVRPAVAR